MSDIEQADQHPPVPVPVPVPQELGEPGQQVASIVRAVATGIGLWAGPLPNPADLQAYEDTLPGFADRIVTHFEREQKGRQRYKMTELWLRYCAVLLGVGGAIWGVYLGRGALAVGALAGGVGVGVAFPAVKRLLDHKGDKD